MIAASGPFSNQVNPGPTEQPRTHTTLTKKAPYHNLPVQAYGYFIFRQEFIISDKSPLSETVQFFFILPSNHEVR